MESYVRSLFIGLKNAQPAQLASTVRFVERQVQLAQLIIRMDQCPPHILTSLLQALPNTVCDVVIQAPMLFDVEHAVGTVTLFRRCPGLTRVQWFASSSTGRKWFKENKDMLRELTHDLCTLPGVLRGIWCVHSTMPKCSLLAVKYAPKTVPN